MSKYYRETFENSTILGYTTRPGDCKTIYNTTPSYIEKNNIDIDTCTNQCNTDDNCTGFSYDNNLNKCIIFTPSIGKNTPVAGDDTNNSPVVTSLYTSTTGNNNICYIKNNDIPEGYESILGGLCSGANGTTKRNVSFITYKECYTACNLDSKCQGFSYNTNGMCAIHNPSFPQNTQIYSSMVGWDFDWTKIDNDPKATSTYSDMYTRSVSWDNLGVDNSGITKVVPSAGWNCYKKKPGVPTPVVSATYSQLQGACRSGSNTLYPIYTNNWFGFEYNEPGVVRYTNVAGQDKALCEKTCNNDPLCSGYAWLNDSGIPSLEDLWENQTKFNRCQLYNYTFSNLKGTIDTNPSAIPYNYSDARYSPVYTSDNSTSWQCNIKTRPTLSNYKSPIYGKCQTVDNKDLPFTLGKTTYTTCRDLCEKDYNCNGYSYGNDGTCIIHNPTIAKESGNATSGAVLSRANGDINYQCYIKSTSYKPNIISINNDFSLPVLNLQDATAEILTTPTDIWTGGEVAISSGMTTTNRIVITKDTGVTNLGGIQYGFADPYMYIEQSIPNRTFIKGQYTFNINGYNNSFSVAYSSSVSIIAVDNSNPDSPVETVIKESTLNNINSSYFKLSVSVSIDITSPYLNKNIKIRINNLSPIRLYYIKAELIFYEPYIINYQQPTTSTIRTTTTTTPTTSTTTQLTTTSSLETTTTAPLVTTTTTPLVTTTTTTAPLVTTAPRTFSPQTSSSLINTQMLNPNTVEIVFSDTISPSNYNSLVESIKNKINRGKTIPYVFNNTYNPETNTYTLNVSNSTNNFTNIENFEVENKGFTVNVVFQDNIQASDPLTVMGLMNTNDTDVLQVLPPTSTSTSTRLNNYASANIATTTSVSTESSSSNKGLIIGLAIGGIVLLIIIVVIIYFKFIKPKSSKPSKPSESSESSGTHTVSKTPSRNNGSRSNRFKAGLTTTTTLGV